jgi:hypothetical protein
MLAKSHGASCAKYTPPIAAPPAPSSGSTTTDATAAAAGAPRGAGDGANTSRAGFGLF